jgi:hypothetical protein
MSRLAPLVALIFIACGPSSPKVPDADPTQPDAPPPCDYTADADGDTIADCDERVGVGDIDGDTNPNDHDTDSDGDGYPDMVEAGDGDLTTPPQDTDGDGEPNFIDIDSDNDGLTDDDELSAGTDPTDTDTDGDGFSDLVEVVIHDLCVMNPLECNGDPDPLDPNQTPSDLDYFFILPYMDPEQRKPLDFATDIGVADLHISMDTTGSMGSEIANLKTNMSQVITQVAAEVPNTAFGVSRYEDFPIGGYGFTGDLPFELHQRVTTNTALAQAGVNALNTRNGNDLPESGWEALYRIGTGGALSWTGGVVAAYNPTTGSPGSPVQPYDPATNGLLGGVGFREGALPIVVQIADARYHDTAPVPNPCGGDVYGSDVSAHSKVTAISSMVALSSKVLGVASNENFGGCSPRPDMEEIATATGARVAPAAFDLGGRPPGCSATQCCTGVSGVGRATDGDGLCPLVFDVNGDGSGNTAQQVIRAVKLLVNFSVIDVSAQEDSVPQPNAFGGLTDPADFITDIVPVTLTPLPPGGVMLDPTGHIFLDVEPGTTATFDVQAENTFLMQAQDPQVFTMKIRVVGDGVTVLDTRQVVIIVPPEGTIIE